MTPEQALQLLDQVASNAQLGRAPHVQLQEAVRVLAEAIEAPKAAEAAKRLKKPDTS